MASNNPAAATVAPSSVTLQDGDTTAPLVITGVSPGLASITGAAPGFSVTASNVTVTSALLLLGPIPTVGLGQSTGLQLSLSEAAVADVVVTLESSDSGVATVTSPVTIATGRTTPRVAPQVTVEALGSTTIRASARSR